MASVGLKKLIRTVSGAYPDLSPIEVAHRVACEAKPDDFADLLVPIVRLVMERSKNQPAPIGHRPPSPKLEQRRNWWRDMLNNRVHVGKGVQKALADCTIDDLTFCIKERESTISTLHEQVTNFQHLINLMLKHGAYTVAALPEQKAWDPQ